MNVRKHIPNALTCANLACGCYACILALSGNYECAMWVIFAAAGFDFVDGLAARLLKVCSPIGKDLDSLADLVSFGVAPGMMLFDFIDKAQKTVAWSHPLCGKVFLLAAMAIPVFSALRLAKFNNDTRQSESFIGLPVPAHAIFWVSYLCFIAPFTCPPPGWFPGEMTVFLCITALMAIGSSLLLVSNVPMFSLKVKSLRWKENKLRYLFLLISLGLVTVSGVPGITASIILYVLLSIFNKRT